MGSLITVVATVAIFGLVIFIHELGHFLSAKACGVKVNEFALGMGPKLISFGKKETKYSLRLLPIGGYVQMEGEDFDSNDERAFFRKPVWKRIIIVAAGAFMNLVLGFLVVCIMTSVYTTAISSTTVAQFNEGASTQASGLAVGDKILKINDRTVNIARDITLELQYDEDLVVDMVVLRNGEKVTLQGVKFDYTDAQDEITGESYKNFVIDFKVLGIKKTFFSVIRQSFYESVAIAKTIWTSLGDLITNPQLNKISGVVGVGQVIGQAAGLGFEYLLNILAFITINLGIFNLLPIPALDGGRLLFLVIEAIIRRPIPKKFEGVVHTVGFAILILLMLVVTFKDIFMLFVR